jgi:hypothetical protein
VRIPWVHSSGFQSFAGLDEQVGQACTPYSKRYHWPTLPHTPSPADKALTCATGGDHAATIMVSAGSATYLIYICLQYALAPVHSVLSTCRYACLPTYFVLHPRAADGPPLIHPNASKLFAPWSCRAAAYYPRPSESEALIILPGVRLSELMRVLHPVHCVCTSSNAGVNFEKRKGKPLHHKRSSKNHHVGVGETLS